MTGTRSAAWMVTALFLALPACGPTGSSGGEAPPVVETPGGEIAPGDGDTPTTPDAPDTPTPPMDIPDIEPPPCPEGMERAGGNCVPTNIDEEMVDGLAERFSALYAVQTVIAMTQNVPILGELDNISTIMSYVEIRTNDEGELVMIQNGCGARSYTGDAITVEIPTAVAESVGPHETVLTVWEQDGVVHWTRPRYVIPIGIRLDDPINDALPTDPNDQRIWDQDEDGNPGITVKVSGFAEGDIFVIQKQISNEHGTLEADGTLVGLVEDRSEQVVIGATNPLLNQAIESRPHENGSLSTMRAKRIEEIRDCEWLEGNAEQLFPSDG